MAFIALTYDQNAKYIAAYTIDGAVYSIDVESSMVSEMTDAVRKLLQPDLAQEAMANEGEEGDNEEEVVIPEGAKLRLNVFGVNSSPNHLVQTLVYRY